MPELRVHPRLLRPQGTRPVLLCLCIAVLLAGAAGCGGPAPAATATPPAPSLTADEVLLRAAESMKSVPAFRFRLSHPSGSTVLPGGVQLDYAEGAVVAPDRLQVTADASLGRSFVRLSAIVAGEQVWFTNPLGGGWIRATAGESPFGSFDLGRLVAGILEGVGEVRFPPAGAAAGDDYRVSGRAGASVLAPLVGEVDANRDVEFELRIDASTFRLKRAEIRGAVSPLEDPSAIRVIELFDFDAVIDIKPPI